MQPLVAGRPRDARARAARRGARRGRTAPASSGRQPRAARAARPSAQRTGWDGAAGRGSRSTSASRSPPGMAGGSADAARGAAARRARAPGVARRRAAARDRRAASAPTSPRRCARARYLATGAGELLRALPDAAAVRRPRRAARAQRLSTADVFRRGRPPRACRARAALEARRAELVAALAAGGAAMPPGDLLVNDLEPAARVAAARSSPTTLDDVRGAGADTRWSAARGRPWSGLFADLERRARGRGRAGGAAAAGRRRALVPGARSRRARTQREVWPLVFAAALGALPASAPAPARAEPLLIGGALAVVGALRLRHRRSSSSRTSSTLLARRRQDARARGPTCSSARWRSSRPARSSASIAPGETAMILGGVVAGQGQIDVITLIGDRLGLRGRRRLRELLPRPPPRARVPGQARPARADHPGAARARSRGSSTSHGGKAIFIGRFVGLVRAIAPFLAGSARHAVPALPAVRRPRRGAVGDDVHPARLRLLAQLRPRADDRQDRARSALGHRDQLIVGIVWLVRWLREEENRARLERGRRLRALDRPRAAPCLRAASAAVAARAGAVLPGAASRPGSSGSS